MKTTIKRFVLLIISVLFLCSAAACSASFPVTTPSREETLVPTVTTPQPDASDLLQDVIPSDPDLPDTDVPETDAAEPADSETPQPESPFESEFIPSIEIPSVTKAPTATPTPEPDTRFPELEFCENTIMNSSLFESEAEASRYLFKMAAKGYYQFGILVTELSMLHTADEYQQIYSELSAVEIESVTKYHNGYYLRFSNVTAPTDAPLRYAVRTGDTSFLTGNEIQCYQLLYDIADQLQLAELSPIDAVLAVHDFLVLNTAYDTPAFESGQNTPSHYATGTLLSGNAVCSGYASSFLLLMQIAGIPCEYVHSEDHAWNLVQIADEWYHIDVTWDDPAPDQPGVVSYSFFMMTDEETATLDDHHIWECECKEHPACTSNEYRIYPYREFVCTTAQEAAELMLLQADENEVLLVYPADGELTMDSLLDLAVDTLQITGGFSYYAPVSLGVSHLMMTIITN